MNAQPRLAAMALLALAALADPRPARAADVFSPGDLSRAHARLSGLENCTRCHPAGEQLSQQRCLDCHAELQPRVSAGQGFHGRMKQADRDCWRCHHEHQGADAALVEWPGGGERRFDHAATGTALGGKHAALACEKCHDRRLVKDAGVRAMLDKQPGRRTFLGLPALAACASCHADEHRGQLGPDCARCHADKGWKPAAGFDHARTAYPLTGRHQQVACQKCHAREEQGAGVGAAPVGPASPAAFTRFRPVAHASCGECHRDPHEGRFGPGCAACHSTGDWRRVTAAGAGERAFHDRTRYPLQGAHQTVACVACHGPWPGAPARFKGLAFGACTDCHLDAHAGQLAAGGPGAGACDRCHDVTSFQRPRFGLAEHDQLRFKLQFAHRVVACDRCHRQDPSLADRVPAAARQELARRGRPVRVSLAVLDLGGKLGRCETCHADPHGGQLQREDGCAACHGMDSFRKVRFDHARDSRFPLTGQHARAACAACHRPDPATRVVRYQRLPLRCAGCHADPHAGQFARPAAARGEGAPPAAGDDGQPAVDCARCHDTASYRATLFRHEPPFTDYLLAGKHRAVACARCHPEVDVGGGVKVRRYRPLPRACEGCHADFHRGAFSGFAPPERRDGSEPARPTP